jgi:hypothetical protein
MKRKCLAVGIIFLFIGTTIIPSNGEKIEKSSSPIFRNDLTGIQGNVFDKNTNEPIKGAIVIASCITYWGRQVPLPHLAIRVFITDSNGNFFYEDAPWSTYFNMDAFKHFYTRVIEKIYNEKSSEVWFYLEPK